jgi:hypothetical protein
MTTFNRCIAAATLFSAMALAPGLASADDDRNRQFDRQDRHEQFDRLDRHERLDREERHERADRRDQGPRFMAPTAAPGWATRDHLRWNERGAFGGGWERHERSDRFLQVRAVRNELFVLERDRADFYARNAYRPWLLARYDAEYFERHAELERRLERLTTYAWR